MLAGGLLPFSSRFDELYPPIPLLLVRSNETAAMATKLMKRRKKRLGPPLPRRVNSTLSRPEHRFSW
jgi:hypothetical protein